MIFNIDEEMILSSLEAAMSELPEEQAAKVAGEIDNALPGLLDVLVSHTERFWKDTAQSEGGGWGSKYAFAIKSEVTGNEGRVFIDESEDAGSTKSNFMFAMMIEQGVKSWSIKDALLSSNKAKIGKNGIKYIVVPFPVAVPSSVGSGVGKSIFGGREMTVDMYKLVKDGKKASGFIKSGRAEMDAAGLVKFRTPKFHSQYGIFRCVSEKSSGWQYPNKAASSVFPTVIKYINKRVGELVNEFCRAVVAEYS